MKIELLNKNKQKMSFATHGQAYLRQIKHVLRRSNWPKCYDLHCI